MSTDDDYTITNTNRHVSGHVTYHFTDRYGQRSHVTVPYHLSTPEHADPTIRRVVATLRPKRRVP